MATVSFISLLFISDVIYEINQNTWTGVSGTYVCDGVELIGGYKVFGQNHMASQNYSLPQHTSVLIKVFLYLIDSWDNERVLLTIDGVNKIDQRRDWHNDYNQMCGDPFWSDYVITYNSGWVSHTNNSIFIKVQSFLDSLTDDESFGWKVEIFYRKDECFLFYTQINYQGTEYKFCQSSPLQTQYEILDEILSFKIPPDQQLILQGQDFNNGVLTTFTTDQPNLSQPFKFPKQNKRVSD